MTTKKKKAPLGSGKRFAALASKLKQQGHSAESAGAIAASIGRAKYGAKRMSKLAARGQKRAAKKKG